MLLMDSYRIVSHYIYDIILNHISIMLRNLLIIQTSHIEIYNNEL